MDSAYEDTKNCGKRGNPRHLLSETTLKQSNNTNQGGSMERCSVCGEYYDDDNDTQYWCFGCDDRPNQNHNWDEPFIFDHYPNRWNEWDDFSIDE